jgi:hypothetical protein
LNPHSHSRCCSTPRRRVWGALLTAASATLLVALASGCSISEPKKQAQSTTQAVAQAPADSARYLSLKDLRKLPRGSAPAVVLTFWYAVQQRDLPLAYSFLSPGFISQYARTFRHFNDYILADYARWLVKPHIVSVAISGMRGSVVLSYPTPGDPKARTTYLLSKLPDGWKISYEYYLIGRLTAVQRSARPGRP